VTKISHGEGQEAGDAAVRWLWRSDCRRLHALARPRRAAACASLLRDKGVLAWTGVLVSTEREMARGESEREREWERVVRRQNLDRVLRTHSVAGKWVKPFQRPAWQRQHPCMRARLPCARRPCRSVHACEGQWAGLKRPGAPSVCHRLNATAAVCIGGASPCRWCRWLRAQPWSWCQCVLAPEHTVFCK